MGKKLVSFVLLSAIVLSVFAVAEFFMPVQAAGTAGVHQVTVNYYMAFIHNDHDTGTIGEWAFRLRAPYPEGTWTSYAWKDTESGNYANFVDRVKSWYITGNVDFTFRMAAREEDGAFGATWWDYTSRLTWDVYWPWPSQAIGQYYDREYKVGDVTHFFAYYIANNKPTITPVSGPSSGSTGNPYTFSTTGSDADGDSITYKWIIWKKYTTQYWYPTETGSSLSWTFPTAGTYQVFVQATDALNTKSPSLYKEITISQAIPTITFTRVWTTKSIYKVGENIIIKAKIKEGGVPKTSGTVYARIYAMGSTGKASYPITPYGTNIPMTLVNAAQGIWKGIYGPILGPANQFGFQGTYVVRVYVDVPSGPPPSGTATPAPFVANILTESWVAKFLKANSPSRVAVGNNFEVNARIKNPSGSSQTLQVRLILPSGMTQVSGALTRTITLAPGAAKTLRWTLKSTTATNKLVKIKVFKVGTVRAKLIWYIRDP